jgi:hypothetical protein
MDLPRADDYPCSRCRTRGRMVLMYHSGGFVFCTVECVNLHDEESRVKRGLQKVELIHECRPVQ